MNGSKRLLLSMMFVAPAMAGEAEPRKRIAVPPTETATPLEAARQKVSAAARQSLRIKVRAQSRVEYADFIIEAALDEPKIHQLLDALTDRDEIYAYEANTLDMDLEAMDRRLTEADRVFFGKVRGFLGETGAKRLRAYEDATYDRKTIYQLASELAVGPDPHKPSPMSEEQRRQLLKYVIDDAERHPLPAKLPSPEDKAGQEAHLRWERDRQLRLDAMVRSLLSVEQYRHFRESRKAQQELEESRGW